MNSDAAKNSPYLASNPAPGGASAAESLQLRQELVRYVTGALSEEEASAFELRMIDDDAFAELVELAEQDVLEDYALGELPGAEAARLTPWIEDSPRRQAHVRITQLLAADASGRASASAAAPPRKQRNRVWLAVAACLLLAAGLSVGIQHPAWWHLQQHAPEPPTPIGAVSPVHPQPMPGTADVILLAAERLRGAGPSAGVYKLHPNAPIRVQILLPQTPSKQVYALAIRAAGEATRRAAPIAQFSNLAARRDAGAAYVEVDLLPGTLQPGNYIVSIGTDGGASSETTDLALRIAAP